MKHTITILSISSTTALLFAGCGQGILGDSLDDLVRDAINDDGGSGIALSWNAAQSPDLAYPSAGIAAFGRSYDEVSADYAVRRQGQTAEADIQRVASGEFEVLRQDGTSFTKPILSDEASRSVIALETLGGRWNLDQVTVYQGSSADGETQIERVTVAWGENSVVFDDPAELHDTEILSFAPDQEVTVTVLINDADVIGVIHQLSAEVAPLTQKLLEPVTATEVSNTYSAPSEPGLYFTYVDIFDEAAVTDELASYSAAAWGMPYHVIDEE